MNKSILVVAGEHSGDMHAARVVHALKERQSDLTFWGIGGDDLHAEGVELLHDAREMAVLGFAEVLAKYSFFKGVFNEVLAEVETRKPDAALLVDYPGFNLRLAEQLKKRGIKVLYYICPQVWAWHRERIPKMAKIIDRLMVIFPFETDVFKGVKLKVDFVGHPLVIDLCEFRAAPAEPLPWNGKKKIALLPGSRKQEIKHILPVLLRTAREMETSQPGISFLIAVPQRQLALTEHIFQKAKAVPRNAAIVTGRSREVLRQADAAFVASGTATLEAALLHCPTVLVYKTAAFNYWLGKKLIRVPHLGIVNIISGQEVMPERIQQHMRPMELAAAIDPLLNDTPQRKAMIEQFQALENLLGTGRPADRVAEIILEEIGG
jgi:lipid-A-disaccharide synthase